MVEVLSGLTTKDKIVKITLDIISGQGFQNVTVRKIAAMAGVNVAAVNYHFGSKDALINETLKLVTVQLKNAFKYLKDAQQEPEVRLEMFLNKYTEIIFKYPDIMRNMINRNIHLYPIRIEYQEYLKDEGIDLIVKTIGQIRYEEDHSLIYMRSLQLISCLSFPILLGDQLKEVSGIDISDAEIRHQYIALLQKNIIGVNAQPALKA